MTLSTPNSIRTLQRKLYRKAKCEPTYRFYALYDKVYRADILRHAYDLVRANKGSAGIDGVTFEAIEAGEGVDAFVAGLGEALCSKTYRPEPVRRVQIPKPGQLGQYRGLGIPTIRDRVAQTAAKLVLEPVFEADFCEHSYGFRPGRSAHDAVEAVAEVLLRGHYRVIDADVASYFDDIPHAKLLAVVAERVSDGAIVHLLKMWLKAPVVGEDSNSKRRTVGGGKRNRRGTPQGGVISPLLSNLYLHLLDRIWTRHCLEERLHARLVRYCDDFVVLCARGVERPQAVLRQVLERMDLRLNEAKTRTLDAREESFDFLGFELRARKSWRSGKHYPHVQPSRRSQRRIKDRVKWLTRRERSPVPLTQLVEDVNQSLRGWVGYFHHGNCSSVLSHVKAHAETRLRLHLRRRHGVPTWNSALKRFPSPVLYDVYGLYKVPTTAGWTRAHASR